MRDYYNPLPAGAKNRREDTIDAGRHLEAVRNAQAIIDASRAAEAEAARETLLRQEAILSRPSRVGPDGTRYSTALLPGDKPGWSYWAGQTSVMISDADLPDGTVEEEPEYYGEDD